MPTINPYQYNYVTIPAYTNIQYDAAELREDIQNLYEYYLELACKERVQATPRGNNLGHMR